MGNEKFYVCSNCRRPVSPNAKTCMKCGEPDPAMNLYEDSEYKREMREIEIQVEEYKRKRHREERDEEQKLRAFQESQQIGTFIFLGIIFIVLAGIVTAIAVVLGAFR